MKRWVSLLSTLIGASLLVTNPASAAERLLVGPALVGEVRTLAVDRTDQSHVTKLHRAGWLEAEGQLLRESAFPELFEVIGRSWTADSAEPCRFAVPDLRDRTVSAASSDDPFRVLGGGDLVSGGRTLQPRTRQMPLTRWIYAGREVTSDALAARSCRQ